MAWQDDAILILRTLIWDNGETLTYSDSRLEEVLIVAATHINVEIDFSTDYTIDVNAISVDPDPSTDQLFMYFLTLKAACMVDRGNMRQRMMIAGIEARCGPAIMRLNKHSDGFKVLMEQGYCAAYDEARFQQTLGNASYVRAILSPFVNGDFDPERYGRGNVDYGRVFRGSSQGPY